MNYFIYGLIIFGVGGGLASAFWLFNETRKKNYDEYVKRRGLLK